MSCKEPFYHEVRLALSPFSAVYYFFLYNLTCGEKKALYLTRMTSANQPATNYQFMVLPRLVRLNLSITFEAASEHKVVA